MNRKKLSLMILAFLLIAGVAGAQDQYPINPAPGYYGSVTVNGQPAPSGTIITAKIGTDVRGSITTSVSGSYGDKQGPSKLWITGFPNEIGSTVTFYINDVATQQTSTLTGERTLNRVDLTLTFEVPTGRSTGGASAGGGGGGGISGEPSENIELYETREADLVAGIPVTFKFTTPQLTVYELVITSNVSAGLTSAKIEHLKGTSKLVTSPPPGNIHKNVNIWLGPPGFAVPKNIKEGIIRFRVNNSWISGENIDAASISLMRWDGSQWISLDTKQVRTDDQFVYYEALSNSFSPFAISGAKAISAPVVTSGGAPEASPGVTAIAAPLAIMPPTALNLILYVIVAIIIIAGVYYFAKKKD